MLNFLKISGVGDFMSDFFASVKNAFVNFHPTDVVDILLLASILFVAFRFFKSRKAGVLLVGVLLIIVLTAVTYIFNLDATYFIFSSILDIGVLALIILFQPEIRDALEKVGSGSVFGIMSLGDQRNKLNSKAINEVCTAVSELSRSKTGALIVFSRTTKLDEIIETGTVLNADINALLIRNIFVNKAPLHDGAVIIDNGCITAAMCLLPLSRRNDVDSELGTRHRAALGMSESSDAVIVVVSEETGTISVAHDCTLTRDYTVESLRTYLKKKILRIEQNDSEK